MTSEEKLYHPILDDSKSYFQRLQVSSQSLLNGDISQVSRTRVETRIQLLNTLINSKTHIVGYSDDFKIIFPQLRKVLQTLLLKLPSDVEEETDVNHKGSFPPGVFSKEEIFSSGEGSEKKEIIQLVDGVSYNPNTWIISDGKGNDVGLTKSEALIFSALLQKPYSVFSRNDLLDALGDYGERTDRIIDVFIGKISNKLDLFGLKNILQNAHGQGYILQIGNFDITPVKNKIELENGIYFIPEHGGMYVNGEIKVISSGFLPILTKLVGKKGQVFSDEILMREAGMKVGSSKGVISRIRKELNALSPGLGNHIKTARGDGYYWQ